MQQSEKHRWDAREDGDPIALDNLEYLLGVETRNQRERGTHMQRDIHHGALSERMEHGQHCQRHVIGHAAEDMAVHVSFMNRFRCVSSAPFGLPVVPDVYRITAVSSPAVASVSNFGSPVMSSAKL